MLKLMFASLLFCGLLLSSPLTVSAQSLQSESSGLQSQTGQTQTSTNTQNEVRTLQNNGGGQEVLNQGPQQSLGVVSDPRQSAPEAVVLPSGTLATDVKENRQSDTSLWRALGFLILAAVSFIILRRLIKRWQFDEKESAGETKKIQSAAAAEPIPPKPKKKKSRSKRKKPHQR